MHVIDHLEEEHRKVETMLRELKEVSAGPQRQRLVFELKTALSTHMAVEERFIYPLLADNLDAEQADEAADEHALARDGLAAAEERVEDGAFVAAIESLEAGIKHHVEEEEQELFPELRAKCAEQLDAMDPEQLEAEVIASGDGVTRDDLYRQAQAVGIAGRSKMTKDELAEALNAH